MTTFQVLGLAVIGCLLLVNLRNMMPGRGRFAISLGWSLIWIAGAVALVNPDMTARLARALGIGRGADLVSYVAAIALTIGFFVVYLRFRALERNLTILVRRVALLGAKTPEDAPPERPEP